RLHVLAPVSIETGRDSEIRDTLARLVRQGFTRVFAGGVELRLDEEDPGDVLRRVLDRLQAARAEVGDDGEDGDVGEPLRDPDGGSASARDEASIPPIESLLGEVSPDEIRAAERAAAALKDSRAKGLLVVIDRLVVREGMESRLQDSIGQALTHGAGVMALRIEGLPIEFHTREPSCPWGHFRLDAPLSPRMFSFNSVEGACASCRGTGLERRIVISRMI